MPRSHVHSLLAYSQVKYFAIMSVESVALGMDIEAFIVGDGYGLLEVTVDDVGSVVVWTSGLEVTIIGNVGSKEQLADDRIINPDRRYNINLLIRPL